MISCDGWANRHWELVMLAAAFGLAVVISLGLGIAYNVAAVGFDPPAAEWRSASPGSAEPPRDPPAPYF